MDSEVWRWGSRKPQSLVWQGKAVTPHHLPFQEAEPLRMPQREKPALPHMALQWLPPWTSELWLLLLDACPQPWREHGLEDLKGFHLSPRKQEENKDPSACACRGWTGNGSSLSSSLPLLSVSSLLPAPLSHAKHVRTNSKKQVCLWGEFPEF